jgi:hypothetical protein
MFSGRKTQYIKFVYKGVLYRKIEENLTTHYSLTKEFKDSLDRQKGKSPTNYEYTLSLPQFTPEADGRKQLKSLNLRKMMKTKRYSILVQ